MTNITCLSDSEELRRQYLRLQGEYLKILDTHPQDLQTRLCEAILIQHPGRKYAESKTSPKSAHIIPFKRKGE